MASIDNAGDENVKEVDSSKDDIFHRLAHLQPLRVLLQTRYHGQVNLSREVELLSVLFDFSHPDYEQLLHGVASVLTDWRCTGAPLEQAILAGDVSATQMLLDVQPLFRNWEGNNGEIEIFCGYLARRPAELAYYCGHDQVLSLLESRGAKVAFASDASLEERLDGWRLRRAVREGSVRDVKSACSKVKDIDAVDEYGRSPLFFASLLGFAEKAVILLEHGAHALKKDLVGGQTVLCVAIYRKHCHLVRLLLDSLHQPEKRTRLTRRRSKDVESPTKTHMSDLKRAITIATARQDEETLQLLLECAGSSFYGGALRAAVQLDSKKLLTMLLSKSNFSQPLSLPMEYYTNMAACCGNSQAVEALLQHGSQVGCQGNRVWLLHSAISGGSLDVVLKLTAAGSKVNTANSFGNTPLHLAAYNNQPRMVKLLLELVPVAQCKAQRPAHRPKLLVSRRTSCVRG